MLSTIACVLYGGNITENRQQQNNNQAGIYLYLSFYTQDPQTPWEKGGNL